ncbi:hypothetical protein C8J57DRAFT_1245719 [Mycena rebaudengoi]|nr:hypothetical protein C8J57DRAFT_1245719 [Mycena rebaudengoi]
MLVPQKQGAGGVGTDSRTTAWAGCGSAVMGRYGQPASRQVRPFNIEPSLCSSLGALTYPWQQEGSSGGEILGCGGVQRQQGGKRRQEGGKRRQEGGKRRQ